MDGFCLEGAVRLTVSARRSRTIRIATPRRMPAYGVLVEWFPMLEGIKFTHTWGGPVGMPRDWMPAVAFDPATRIGFARGYTGQGVSTTNLAGRVLAGLIAGRRSGLETLPLAQRQSPDWEREPLRWIVVRYMQDAFLRIDTAGKTGQPSPKRTRSSQNSSESIELQFGPSFPMS
jgi:hypothetical protein